MPVWWTNRSLPGSSGVMKPKPFSSLNHFTVPVAISMFLPGGLCGRSVGGAKSNNYETRALLTPGTIARPVASSVDGSRRRRRCAAEVALRGDERPHRDIGDEAHA